jgi:hypothetical protein
MKSTKIEIKNIKTNKSFSEETICFTADIYVNGIKTGYARNDGRGGCTDYNRYEGKMELLKEAEAYAKSLPSHVSEYLDRDGKPMVIESDLESIIDYAVDDFWNAREKASANKKMEKHMEFNICYGVPNSGAYRMIGYGKTPLRAVAMTHKAKLQGLVNRIKSELKTGEEILNTNLESIGLIV